MFQSDRLPGNSPRAEQGLTRRHAYFGFTLTEILCVLTVSGVLMSLAAPALGRFVAETQVSGATSALFASIISARSEALKRSGRVVICVSRDRNNCSDDGDWSAGWISFHDRDNDGAHDTDEDLIQVGESRSGKMSITGNGSTKNYVSYVGSGKTQLLNGGLQMGTITICSGGVSQQIVINHAGRPRIAVGGC